VDFLIVKVFIEEIIIYSAILIFCLVVVFLYLRNLKRKSQRVEEKIIKAKEEGIHEPVSLHPVVDLDKCIGSGACISACPEKDILGIQSGKARLINASRCIGHGACFHACPVQAITLCIGTETRGVDLPHINQNFETNAPGVYIAGELGGMGLIKNSVEQGKQAMDDIAKFVNKNSEADYDVIIVGAGPAGISAALNARKNKLKLLILEQDSLGGTVFTFPRSKIVMTSPMDLPLYGKVKLQETSKAELLDLWNKVLGDNDIKIRENCKVESITQDEKFFTIATRPGDQFTAEKVLLAIGRRGTPRKLNIPGENQEKVAYRLLEPEFISDKNIIVVGGGDSAVEAALSLMENNNVTLSYRSEAFKRIKPKNDEKIKDAVGNGAIEMLFNSNLTSITETEIELSLKNGEVLQIKNDLVYIFAGGELPTQFLQKIGINITKRFGYALLKHNKN
jgi:putative YpdA family bacillithiol system oxidoreductase